MIVEGPDAVPLMVIGVDDEAEGGDATVTLGSAPTTRRPLWICRERDAEGIAFVTTWSRYDPSTSAGSVKSVDTGAAPVAIAIVL